MTKSELEKRIIEILVEPNKFSNQDNWEEWIVSNLISLIHEFGLSLIPERKDTHPDEWDRDYGFNDCIDDIKSNLEKVLN